MRRFVLALLALALGLRLVVLFLYPQIPALRRLVEGGDALDYTQLARHLVTEGVLRFDGGSPTAYRMPGYPLFLAACSVLWPGPLPAQLVQILLDTVTVYFVYRMAKNLSTRAWIPLLAGAIMALHPVVVATSVSLYPETLSIFCLAMGCLVLLKVRPTLQSGALLTLVLILGVYLKQSLAPVAIVMLGLFAIGYVRRADSCGGWFHLCSLWL